MYDFFSPDETELCSIIRETLTGYDTVKVASVIKTGWTNITMDVKGETKDYIFRFPRNLFFAKMMVKDCVFCNFVRDKVSLPVPDMQLKVSRNRPFSVHTKIKGASLLSQMDKISSDERNSIIEDLSIFLSELHALSADSMPLEIKESLGNFLDGLAGVNKGNYDFSYHAVLYNMEQNLENLRIVHGDFHPGNVLIQDGHVSGIIDFSFSSVSDRHADLGRFMGRSDSTWGNALIEAYQNKTGTICDLKKVYEIVDVFKYVEYKYVQYMQSCHPEIIIPDSVLQMAKQESVRFEKTEDKKSA